jgi:hypothetical protein
MLKSVFTRRIASSRRALKKQFAGNRKDSSDPAQTTAGEESGSHYSKEAAEIYGELRAEGKKGKDGVGHSVALKAYPEYAHLPMDSQRLLRYSLRAAVYSVRHQSTARTRRTNRPKCWSTVAPVYRWSVSRRPPLTGVLGCFLCSSR